MLYPLGHGGLVQQCARGIEQKIWVNWRHPGRLDMLALQYGLLQVVLGGLAQMVERSLSMREVLGSMPRSSTKIFTPLSE